MGVTIPAETCNKLQLIVAPNNQAQPPVEATRLPPCNKRFISSKLPSLRWLLTVPVTLIDMLDTLQAIFTSFTTFLSHTISVVTATVVGVE